jgi:hypothetical protein
LDAKSLTLKLNCAQSAKKTTLFLPAVLVNTKFRFKTAKFYKQTLTPQTNALSASQAITQATIFAEKSPPDATATTKTPDIVSPA